MIGVGDTNRTSEHRRQWRGDRDRPLLRVCSSLQLSLVMSAQLLWLSLVLLTAGVRFTVVKRGDAKPTVHTFN